MVVQQTAVACFPHRKVLLGGGGGNRWDKRVKRIHNEKHVPSITNRGGWRGAHVQCNISQGNTLVSAMTFAGKQLLHRRSPFIPIAACVDGPQCDGKHALRQDLRINQQTADGIHVEPDPVRKGVLVDSEHAVVRQRSFPITAWLHS